MRQFRAALLIAATFLAACSSFRDIFSSHAETAARVGTRELKSAHVAEIITRVGGANANPQAAEVVAGIWVDLSLFGERVARRQMKADSALIEKLLWPQIAQAKAAALGESLAAHRAPPSAAEADSVYNAGNIRVFQHILVQPSGTTTADSAKAQAQAERLIPQARLDFAKTAEKNSADQQNKADAGYLPPSEKGAFVPEFETAAWALTPGQLSGVVKSPFGYHIIRRPSLTEVRDRLIQHLGRVNGMRQDSVYYTRLAEQNEITVKSGAASAMRSALSDLSGARKSRKVLVSYRDGAFTVGDFARWMGAMPPQQLGQIRQANDTLLTQFVRNLAQNAVYLRVADSAKITMAPPVYNSLSMQYRSAIADLQQAIGLDGAEFSDSSKTSEAERIKLAGQKVDEYFDKVTKGQTQFRQIPPTLSAELRSEGDHKIYQAGIAKAVELILAKRRADSAAAAAAPPPPPPGTLQQAPGGPPKPNNP